VASRHFRKKSFTPAAGAAFADRWALAHRH